MNARRTNDRAILSSPIKAYKFKPEDRDRLVNDALVDRVNTALAVRGIPVNDPHRWERLSWSLLCVLFPEGFAILEKPRGGDKKTSEQVYANFSEKFELFFAGSRYPSRTAAAVAFLRKNSGKVSIGRETISTHQGLLRAVRRGNTERQRQFDVFFATDSASVMVRYGTRLALFGPHTGISPLVTLQTPKSGT
jgi:hypothetical protein